MSSLLFQPECLNPLEGLIDFTLLAKPFHTKLLETSVKFSFDETIEGTITECFNSVIQQKFDDTNIDCPEPLFGFEQGFEVGSFDQQDGLLTGFEPTVSFDFTVEPTQYPADTTNHLGQPLYYDFYVLPPAEPLHTPSAFVSFVSIAYDTFRVRVTIPSTSLLKDGDEIVFTQGFSTNPEHEHFNTYFPVDPSRKFILKQVDTLRTTSFNTVDDQCNLTQYDPFSWFMNTFELLEVTTTPTSYVVSTGYEVLPFDGSSIDLPVSSIDEKYGFDYGEPEGTVHNLNIVSFDPNGQPIQTRVQITRTSPIDCAVEIADICNICSPGFENNLYGGSYFENGETGYSNQFGRSNRDKEVVLGVVETFADLPSTNLFRGYAYVVRNENQIYVWNGSSWATPRIPFTTIATVINEQLLVIDDLNNETVVV